MEMNAQPSELQAAENNLKQLMAEVTRAMEKAQEAVVKISLQERDRHIRHTRDGIHDFVPLERAPIARRASRRCGAPT
jgi:hypothetical protein